MSSFFWNVCGFNKTLKHSVLKDWLSNKDLKFGCILETRVKEGKAGRILSTVFKDWSYMTNYEYSQGGRVWVVWKDTVRMTPVYKSYQMITCSVSVQGFEEFFCSFVYASNAVEGRMELWDDICHHKNSAMFRNKALMIMSDFNKTLDVEDSSSFTSRGRVSTGMREFQRMVLHCRFSDMG